MSSNAKRKKVAQYSVVGVTVIAVLLALWYGFRPRPPRTLVEAVQVHPEVFPAGHRVILPLSASPRLGYIERREGGQHLPENNYAVTEDAPCFFVTPTQSSGLSELRVSYGDKRTYAANAELGAAAAAGLSLSEQQSVEMVLQQLRRETGIGWANLNGPCNFANGETVHRVVTGQMVADTITLITAGTSTGEASATAKANPRTPASARAETGWEGTSALSANGRNIVLSASFTNVVVNVATIAHDLGPSPDIGKSWAVPQGIDASLTVDGFDASTREVTFRVTMPNQAAQIAPKQGSVCPVGQSMTLDVGDRCDFQLPPGTAVLAVRWNIETINGVRHVLLEMKTYRTSFSPRT